MNTYLMTIVRFFSGEETFEVEATDKKEAVEKTRKYFEKYGSGNYKLDSIKCKKKLQKERIN